MLQPIKRMELCERLGITEEGILPSFFINYNGAVHIKKTVL